MTPESKTPVVFSRREGEMWYPWDKRHEVSSWASKKNVHAVVFNDGTVFDAYNGWRPNGIWNGTVEQIKQAADENFEKIYGKK